MPIFFVVLGVLLVVVGINDKLTGAGSLVELVKSDFVPNDGSPGFITWFLAIVIIGAVGYIKPLKPVSNAFLILVVVVIIFSRKGFFEKFYSGINSINKGPLYGPTT